MPRLALHPDFYVALVESTKFWLDAEVDVHHMVVALDESGVACETWPGLPGQPAGQPAFTIQASLQHIKRIPVENVEGGSKIVVGLWMIMFAKTHDGVQTVIEETDMFATTDQDSGLLTVYKASNTYQGTSSGTTVNVYCEKIV
jgi:hypothetical protein